MVKIQRVIKSKPRRIYVSTKIVDQKIGFTSGITVNLLQKGETILYSTKSKYPGFLKIGENKVYYTQKYDSVGLPPVWVDQYLIGDHVKVFYTKHGVFIRPVKRMDGYALN